MSESKLSAIDFTQEDDVLQILPRPAQRSSENLGWNGIFVQQHLQPSWETPEYAHTRHMLLVHNPAVTIQAERRFDGRIQQEQLGGGNNTVIVPATVLHQANWCQENPFSLLFLEPDYLTQVAYELLAVNRIELIPQHAMSDPLIEQIGRSLTAELNANMPGSRLFVETLATTLSIHLLRHYTDLQQPLREATGGLSPRKLQQAISYIEDHLAEDLTVSAIANQIQMSQYYFSRLFKQSIGISPYQYVVQQRIKRAAFLLRTTPLSVAAIALQVGFSNQNQLIVQFRRLMHTTPSVYRRNL